MAGQSGVAGRIVAVVATVGLAVGVGVLSVTALQRGEGAAPTGTAGPAPTFTYGDHTSAAATPTPTSTDAGTTVPAAATERFIAVQGDQVWRATAGACTAGAAAAATAPTVEHSTDGGVTWTDATPRDARQVLNLAVFGDGAGEVVAATGADCAPAVLRTYTAGRAWESYPDVLAASTYVSPGDRSQVVVSGVPTAAPCADARSARTSRSHTGIVCDGTAYATSGDRWSELVAGAVALDAVAGDIVVAHTSDECTGGVAVTRFAVAAAGGATGTELGCVSNVDASSPAALSVLDPDLVLWSGDRVHGLD